MKILNDLFSLISGTGKKDNLQDMVEDSPIRVLVALLAVLTLLPKLIISIRPFG